MAFPTVTTLPNPPLLTDNEATFDAKALTWTLALQGWTNSVNAAGDYVETKATEVGNNATAAAGSATLSENWATQTGSTVDGTEYSAKEHASGTTVPAGSAKEWAASTAEVDGGLKGARGYAQDASASASSASADAVRAESAVATLPAGTIADAIIAPDKAWSSQKINSLLTLEDRLSFKSDFVRDEYFVDDGSRTFAPAEYVWDVERATSKWALGANGKYREVPVDTIAREWNPETGEYAALIEGSATNDLKMSTSLATPQWERGGVTADENPTVLIEGFLTTDVEATSSSFPRLQQRGVLFTQGNRKTVSVRFKEKTTSLLHGTIELSGDATLRIYADTDQKRSSAVVNRGDWGAVETQLEKDAQGFHIFSATFTAPADGSYNVFFGPGSIWQSGINVEIGASITFAHAQLEQGTRPTSPIITTDAPKTRAVDSLVTADTEQFNQYQGTLEIVAKVPTGETVATFGSITIVSDSDDLKTYTETYSSDIGTPTLTLGNGVFVSVEYMPEVAA